MNKPLPSWKIDSFADNEDAQWENEQKIVPLLKLPEEICFSVFVRKAKRKDYVLCPICKKEKLFWNISFYYLSGHCKKCFKIYRTKRLWNRRKALFNEVSVPLT